MSVQYSGGTPINRTFTPTTRLAWVQNVTQALSDAGWTTISGTPGTSADVLMESAAQNVGAKIRVRCFDPATGNCAQVTLKDQVGAVTSGIGYCFPNSVPWRVVANKFHFHAFVSGGANNIAARGWIHAGTLWTPTWLGIQSGDNYGFMSYGGLSDTDAVTRSGWRQTSEQFQGGNAASYQAIIPLGLIGSSNSVGDINLLKFQGCMTADTSYRWIDGSLVMFEPFVAFSNSGVEAQLRGQLYDSMMINGTPVGESTTPFDGHLWMAITHGVVANHSATCGLYQTVT